MNKDDYVRKYKYAFDNMDLPSKFEPTTKMTEIHRHAGGETTELGEVKVMTAPSSSMTTTMLNANSSNDTAPCKNSGCKVWSSRGEPRSESPWHSLKTIFLVSVIVAFLLWIIVYTLLDRYRIL
ncbi:uncharacterized protein [Linepithema humile]|uniref:uncharacterized protein isoform X2 n=1 Tax=Linepithema humile TaxID=83485 RepID=UPI00062377CE|nr:PREDICTED: uncharacterized protein LOC105676759 isoform X2 [Linepithema humile]